MPLRLAVIARWKQLVADPNSNVLRGQFAGILQNVTNGAKKMIAVPDNTVVSLRLPEPPRTVVPGVDGAGRVLFPRTGEAFE